MSTTERIFKEYKIVKGKQTKALGVFCSIFPDFTRYNDLLPNEYIAKFWELYEAGTKEDNSINGKVFEYLIISLLINNNILPVYVQAKVAFVPNVDFDLLLYSKEKPIALSIKTSLRERYKQADLEAIALKYVHRKAECYLLTLNEQEVKSVNEKIKTGDVIGIDNVIDLRSKAINELINELKEIQFDVAGKIDIITASAIVG